MLGLALAVAMVVPQCGPLALQRRSCCDVLSGLSAKEFQVKAAGLGRANRDVILETPVSSAAMGIGRKTFGVPKRKQVQKPVTPTIYITKQKWAPFGGSCLSSLHIQNETGTVFISHRERQPCGTWSDALLLHSSLSNTGPTGSPTAEVTSLTAKCDRRRDGTASTRDEDQVRQETREEPVYQKFLSYFFVLALHGSTTLYTRAAFVLLNRFGTRLLEASVATLVIAFTVGRAIDEIQDDIIRETHFKAYAQKFRRRSERFRCEREDYDFVGRREERAGWKAVLSDTIDTKTTSTTVRVDIPQMEELSQGVPPTLSRSATSLTEGIKGTESKDVTTTSDTFIPTPLTTDASKSLAVATPPAGPSRKKRKKTATSTGAKKEGASRTSGTPNQPVDRNVSVKRKSAKKSTSSPKEVDTPKKDVPREATTALKSDDPTKVNKARAGTPGGAGTPSARTSPRTPPPEAGTCPGTPDATAKPNSVFPALSKEAALVPSPLYFGSRVPSPRTPQSERGFMGTVSASGSHETSNTESPRGYMDVTPDFIPSPFKTVELPESPPKGKKPLTSYATTARTPPGRRVTIPGEYLSETSVSAPKRTSHQFFRKTSVMFGSVKSFLRRRLTTATMMDSEYLQERIEWEKGRYTYLQRDVLIGVALTASVGSITNFRGNDCNLYLDRFLQARYQYRELTVARWAMLTVPVVLCAVFFCWAILMMGYYERYDAEEDDEARYAISQVLKHRYHSLGAFKKSEYVASIIPLIWCLSTAAYGLERLTARNTITSPTAAVVGSMLVVLCFVLPRGSPSLSYTSGRMVEWKYVVGSIPWGVILMYAGSNCVARAFEASGLSTLLRMFILELKGMDETACEVVLTVLATVLTELLGSTATASILVPVSVDLAELSRVHPLYYAIPVTIASSLSLVMPMSSLAITVVISYAEIGIGDLLVPGVLIKFFTLMVLLVTINTVGYHVFNLSQFPDRFQKVNASQRSYY